MSITRFKTFALMVVIAASVSTLGCGDDEVTFQDQATIRITNRTGGKILRVFFKTCGAALWGEDRLPSDPVTGVIEVNASRDLSVEAGCYDLKADHFSGPTSEPEPLPEVIREAALVTVGAVYQWDVLAEVDDPGGPG